MPFFELGLKIQYEMDVFFLVVESAIDWVELVYVLAFEFFVLP